MASLDQQRAYREAVARKDYAGAERALKEAMTTGGSELNEPGTAYNRQNAVPQVVDPYAEIKRQQEALLAAQKQQRINALGAQRQSALSSLEAERGTVAPVFLQQRGNLSTTAQQTARGAEQSLAARGLTRGGSAVQGDIARNVALQQGMTSIGEAEAGTLANIAQRKTQAEQAYASGVAQAESEAAATAAQAEIQRLMQAQQAQEATAASEAQAQFDQQKMAQEQANKLQIEQLKIAADEAAASGDFKRAQELAKYKNDLEAETIKLRASIKPVSSGGSRSTSGGSTSDMTVSQRALAKSVESQIAQSPGSYRTILARVTDPIVRAYLAQIYGNATTSGTAASPSEWNFAKAYAHSQGVQGY